MHLISARQFKTTKQLDDFFDYVDRVAIPGRGCYNTLYAHGSIMAALFYEPSTRTRFSFEAAMHKLGGAVISEGNPANLSAAKGETLEDTIRTISQYADVIVLRHPEKGAAERAALVSDVPVINAGDGAGEHPTQALLDMYTIRQNFSFDGLNILLCGDLKHGRTVHSLSTLLSLYKSVRIGCCSPEGLELPESTIEFLKAKDIEVTGYETLEDGLCLQNPNIVYMTRLQKERWQEYQELIPWKLQRSSVNWDNFCLTPELMKHLDEKVLVMHPLPRNEELAGAVDNDPRCVYFTKQVKNGMKVRMGLLYTIFDDKVCYDPMII